MIIYGHQEVFDRYSYLVQTTISEVDSANRYTVERDILVNAELEVISRVSGHQSSYYFDV